MLLQLSTVNPISCAEDSMNNTTALNTSRRVARTFSVSEFMDFGERYGIDYRFPLLAQKPDLSSCSPVLQGRLRR